MAMLQIPHNSDHAIWMRRALDLAREMRGHVWPNPPVGCVIVKDGVVVSQAATHAGGRPHAERKALDQAGFMARDATLYVTLEPCCHWGKTPPCVNAIIESRISNVVCAIRDPDPRVNGGGFAKLRKAGVAVSVGLYAKEAEHIMSGFFKRIRSGVPEMILDSSLSATIPDGVDALFSSSEKGPRLLTQTGVIDLSEVEPDRLLSHMGELGLTSVAVSDRDPAASFLLSSQARSEAEISQLFLGLWLKR